MKPMRKYLLLLLVLSSFSLWAQYKDSIPDDPKVGLVLSGGGAKGFAHVGVLKVLEKAGVRVDYVSGTSMGAVIGGLYASGYNAKELDSVLRVYDLDALVKDELPREVSSFYQKENQAKYALSLPLHKGKIELPTGVSKGQSVYNVFSKLTEHVHQVDDFEQLPIPFFCIATNLETGEEVMLEKGFLPEAIRASASFPGLLTPVDLKGQILVDGGIVDNLPIEKMKAKGVDVIIAVNVSAGLRDIEDLNNLPEILMQIAGFQMYEKWDEKIKMADIYIRPELDEYTTFSFESSEEITDQGEKAALNLIRELNELGDRQRTRPPNSIKNFEQSDEILVKEVVIKGNRNYTDKYCIKKLGIKEGQTVSHEEFLRGIDVLSATDNFKHIFYKLIKVEGGTRIEFDMTENEKKTTIQFGAHYDDVYKTGVLVNLTTKHLLFKNDFISADFVVGDNIRYNVDYFYDNGFNWSFGVQSRFNSFKASLPESTLPDVRLNDPDLSDPRILVRYQDLSNRVFIQSTVKDRWAFRIGLEHKFLTVFNDEVIDGDKNRIHFEQSHFASAFGKIMLDTYDADYFPKKGFFLNADYIIYGLSSDYLGNFNPFSQLGGRIGIAYTFFDRMTLHLISEAGVTIGKNENPVMDYHLGGYNENYINTFVPFYGYEVGELNDIGFLRTALTVRFEIFKKNFLSAAGNFARLDEDLWNDGRIFEDTFSGYAVGYGVKTFLGPIEVLYSWNPDNGANHWYFNVGFWF